MQKENVQILTATREINLQSITLIKIAIISWFTRRKGLICHRNILGIASAKLRFSYLPLRD